LRPESIFPQENGLYRVSTVRPNYRRDNGRTYIVRVAGDGGEFGARVAFVVVVAGAELGLLARDGQAGEVHGYGGHRSGHRPLRSGNYVGRVRVAAKTYAHPLAGTPLQLRVRFPARRGPLPRLQPLALRPPLAALLLQFPHRGIALWDY